MTQPLPPDTTEQRWELLRRINEITDKPMIALAFVWLVLLIVDFTAGLSPFLQTVNNFIWALFILDFVTEFLIAPHKGRYLRQNWLTAVSLVLPALRIFRLFRALRVLRAARAARAISLARLFTSLNRSLKAVQRVLGRRPLGYIVVFTVLVIFAGAAGMLLFENPATLRAAGYEIAVGEGIEDYGEAVWWTSMILTTLGSEYWPQSAEGRILCWVLSLYALGVFSYITATIASYFIHVDRDVQSDGSPDTLRQELAQLQAQMQALTNHFGVSTTSEG